MHYREVNTQKTTEDEDNIFSILDDEYARKILKATSLKPMTAKELSEGYDMSRATVSRRVNTLVDRGLLTEGTRIDPEGHHASEYEANLNRITVTLADGDFEIRILRLEDPADRFTRLWNEVRNE